LLPFLGPKRKRLKEKVNSKTALPAKAKNTKGNSSTWSFFCLCVCVCGIKFTETEMEMEAARRHIALQMIAASWWPSSTFISLFPLPSFLCLRLFVLQCSLDKIFGPCRLSVSLFQVIPILIYCCSYSTAICIADL